MREQDKLDDAIVEFHESIRIKPDYVFGYTNLGLSLRIQGKIDEAIEAFREGQGQVKTNPALLQSIDRELAATERRQGLVERLPEVIQGKERPKDAEEGVVFAAMCSERKLYFSSANLLEQALRDDPKLAENTQAVHRFNAACAAALAGTGQGRDDPKPNDDEKTRLRRQALEWLKADLAFWKNHDANPAQKRLSNQRLLHWKAVADLAGVRDEEALKGLPEEEQNRFREFWKEVDEVLEHTNSKER